MPLSAPGFLGSTCLPRELTSRKWRAQSPWLNKLVSLSLCEPMMKPVLSIIPEASSGRTSVTTAITCRLSDHLWAFFSTHLTPSSSQCSIFISKSASGRTQPKTGEAVEEVEGPGEQAHGVCPSAPAGVLQGGPVMMGRESRGGLAVRVQQASDGVCSTCQEGLQFTDLNQALGKYLPCAERVLSTP